MDDAAASDVTTVQTLAETVPAGGAIATATGTAGLARNGSPATERGHPTADALIAVRQPSDDAALALTERGLRPSVLRLAPVNHGVGDNGFIPTLIRIAREKGVSGYPGDGSARWSAVHVRDTARLFRVAVEAAPTGHLHAVAQEGIALREIAQAIGRHLALPVRPIPTGQVDEHFGFLGMFLKPDTPVSSALTQEATGWIPTEPGLFEETDKGHHFAAAQATTAHSDIPSQRPLTAAVNRMGRGAAARAAERAQRQQSARRRRAAGSSPRRERKPGALRRSLPQSRGGPAQPKVATAPAGSS